MTSIKDLYPLDFKEQERTRIENDQLLLPVIGEIKSGQNIEGLERFAKAYLGMYLDLDNTIPPDHRVELLANPQLASDIKTGFEAILKKDSFPGAQQIANSICRASGFSEELPEGYVLLAALDLFSDNPRYAIAKLPAKTIIAAICFHYAYKTEIQDTWLNHIMQERPQETTEAFTSFWQALIKHGTDHLPGLYQFIDHRDYDNVSREVLLPVLKHWRTVRKKLLRKLLQTSIRTADHTTLLNICEDALSNWNQAEPARYILWLATSFLLAPDRYETILIDYTGRSKEKIIPLIDFVFLVLNDTENDRVEPTTQTLATLLRIIAPKVTPQEDRYGQLCDNTRKVMYLFYQLAISEDTDPATKKMVIERLKQIRVMKLYIPILEYVTSAPLLTGAATDSIPGFEEFLVQLVNQELIKPRIKRYD